MGCQGRQPWGKGCQGLGAAWGLWELRRCLVAGAGSGEVEVVIQDPAGQKGTVEPQLEARGDSTYRCSYQPTMEGVHTVHVTFAGVPIPRSPYTVAVGQGRPAPAASVGHGCGPAAAGGEAAPAPSPGAVCASAVWGSSFFPCGGLLLLLSPLRLSLSTLSPSEELAPAV